MKTNSNSRADLGTLDTSGTATRQDNHSDQPVEYSGRVRYTEKKSRDYQKRSQARDKAELRLIERAFRGLPKGRVLDVPCGGGRVSEFLAQQGHALTAADLSGPMREIAREKFRLAGLNIPVLEEDVEKLTCAPASFDTVICFRLFHHFPNPAIRRRAVLELCRVARSHVALSYFSPASFSALERGWRAFRSGRPPHKFATPLSELEGYFREGGFVLLRDYAQLPFFHTLHLAVFRRQS